MSSSTDEAHPRLDDQRYFYNDFGYNDEFDNFILHNTGELQGVYYYKLTTTMLQYKSLFTYTTTYAGL